jgi:hypothetical protein
MPACSCGLAGLERLECLGVEEGEVGARVEAWGGMKQRETMSAEKLNSLVPLTLLVLFRLHLEVNCYGIGFKYGFSKCEHLLLGA